MRRREMLKTADPRDEGVATPICFEGAMAASSMNEDSERAAIAKIHDHCAVYTQPDVACGILDLVGWKANRDLLGRRLLEPSCGDGSFLFPAIERLLRSASRSGVLTEAKLSQIIVAYEFDPDTAKAARAKVEERLSGAGLAAAVAARLAARWVRCEDFLLAEGLGAFTHVVGNPPYMRWSKLPRLLRRAYEAKLPAHAARGDVCLSFIWRAVELLDLSIGQVAFLCADRWLRCAYGAVARTKLAERVRVAAHLEVHTLPVFRGPRKVGTYAAITVLDGATNGGSIVAKVASMEDLARRLHAGTRARGRNRSVKVLVGKGGAILAESGLVALFERMSAGTAHLRDAGVTIRCGMALGSAFAFIVGEDAEIEPDRLIPFLRASDLTVDGRAVPTKRLADVWTHDGALVDLGAYPALKAHLERHKTSLDARVCVVRPEQWYRTIDRIDRDRLAAPKILVAGMAKLSRVAWSSGGAQPSNALYALTSSDWPLSALYALFRAGVLDVFAAVLAPRFSGGSMRFDGNVLGQVRIPLWSSLDQGIKKALEEMDATAHSPRPDLIAGAYGLRSADKLRILAAVTARPPSSATSP